MGFRDANATGAILYDDANVDTAERTEIGLDLPAPVHESWRGD